MTRHGAVTGVITVLNSSVSVMKIMISLIYYYILGRNDYHAQPMHV